MVRRRRGKGKSELVVLAYPMAVASGFLSAPGLRSRGALGTHAMSQPTGLDGLVQVTLGGPKEPYPP